jgi:hypothetical protein
MQFNVIGTILNSSGYSVHTRNLVNALSKYSDVRLVTQIQQNQATLLNDKELEMVKRKPSDGEINLIITNPLFWKHHLGKRNWCYLVWEGNKVPEYFIEECSNPDIEYILVPSTHTRNAVLNTIDSLSEDECKLLLEKLK